jgi:hypothetical protein
MDAVVLAFFERPGAGAVTERKRSGTAERPGCVSVTERKRSGTTLTLPPAAPLLPCVFVWYVVLISFLSFV